MRLDTALDFFLSNCYIKGLLPRSIENYEKFVRRFISVVGNPELEDLNYTVVQDYLVGLYQAKLSKATIGTYIRHLRVFFRYLESEKYIEDISSKIKPPKQPKKLVRIYTDEEIKQIFEVIDIIPDWMRYRNCAVIALMLDSGLRLNEVCGIGVSDYDIRQGFILIHGKGDKERLVPVGQFAKYYLRRYMAAVPVILPEGEGNYLFVNRDGSPLTRNAVKLLVQKLKNRLPFEFSCHKLRHNFATNYCIDEYTSHGQVDIYKLMILLGHEDIQTTRRYLHLANQIILSKSNVSHLDKIFLETP